MSVIDFKNARQKLLEQSSSNCQSTQSSASDEPGQQLIEDEESLAVIMAIYHLLERARARPFTTKSDVARGAADIVALCACEGLLTTMLPDGTFTNSWLITTDGISWLEGATDALLT